MVKNLVCGYYLVTHINLTDLKNHIKSEMATLLQKETFLPIPHYLCGKFLRVAHSRVGHSGVSHSFRKKL